MCRASAAQACMTSSVKLPRMTSQPRPLVRYHQRPFARARESARAQAFTISFDGGGLIRQQQDAKSRTRKTGENTIWAHQVLWSRVRLSVFVSDYLVWLHASGASQHNSPTGHAKQQTVRDMPRCPAHQYVGCPLPTVGSSQNLGTSFYIYPVI